MLKLYWQAAILTCVLLLPLQMAWAQDVVQLIDSSIVKGRAHISHDQSGYRVLFTCDTCEGPVIISPAEAIGLRQRRGRSLRSSTTTTLSQPIWLEEIEPGEPGILEHRPSRTFYLFDADIPRLIGRERLQVQNLFSEYLDFADIHPFSKSMFLYQRTALQRMVRYIRRDRGGRYPVAGMRIGVSFGRKVLRYDGLSEESYIRNNRNYPLGMFQLRMIYDLPVSRNGMVYWQNDLAFAYAQGAFDETFQHFQNGAEIDASFGQFRTSVKKYFNARSVYPFVRLGGGLNYLIESEARFLRVVQNADGPDIDFGDIPTFDDHSFVALGAIGLEVPVGRRAILVELTVEYEQYGILSSLMTYSVGVVYQIH